MSIFRRRQPEDASSSDTPAESREQLLRRRAGEYLRTLQLHYPRDYARIWDEAASGDTARARRSLRSLASFIDESYIEPILGELQDRITAARSAADDGNDAHPDALRLLLRSGLRAEAVELYQRRTGVDWPEALAAVRALEQQLAEESDRNR